MASKKNCILSVIACLGAVAVLCTVGAFVFASAESDEQFTFNNLSYESWYVTYYQNSSDHQKKTFNFTTNKPNWSLPSSSTSSYYWTFFNFMATTTYSEDVPGTTPVINGFVPGYGYQISSSFDFAIKAWNGITNNDINWLSIKQYIIDNIYLGSNNPTFSYNSTFPGFTTPHYLIKDFENYEIRSSSLSVGAPVTIDSTYVYYPVNFSFDVVFTVPSDLTASNIQYLSLVLFFNRAMFTKSNTCYFYSDYSEFGMFRISGTEYRSGIIPEESSEDTSGGGSGDTSDNGVSDIVEGQKEAVEHGQDLEQSKAQAELDDQNENLDNMQEVFNTRTLAQAFRNLYDGIAYDGSDFHFYFPGSGEVPILEAELWQRQEIPLKEAIDNVPTAILVIIRFLAWLSLGYFMFYIFKKILSLFQGGKS